ncbi:MAG: translocation/assembly module TamB domain-containing protein [Candidatus Omnitrophota bacterium]
MSIKNISFISINIIIAAIFILAVGHYMFFTTNGSTAVATFFLGRYLKTRNINFEKAEGTLRTKLSLHHVLIENAQKLPSGALIKVQRIDITLKEFRLSLLSLDVYNGRLKLPFSDTILFYGNYAKRVLDLNIYSKKVSAREIIDLFTNKRFLSTMSGVFSDVNLHITGKKKNLAMEGKFFINKIFKENFYLTGCAGSVMMYCDDLFEAMSLTGEIVFKSGIAAGNNTAVITLDPSKIVFESDPKRPQLNIRGRSTVEDVNISAVLQGTFDNPKLILSSYPPLTQDLLLVMLATGRSWGSQSLGLGKDNISANLVRDFVDYFIFAGKGTQLARQIGLSDISLSFNRQTKGVGVKTSIVDKVQVSYEIEPGEVGTGQAAATQTVGGQLKITDTVSVAAEKELTQKSAEEKTAENLSEEDRVYLQFKKQF